MFNKTSKPQNRIDSLIGATTRIEGNVIFSGGLRVEAVLDSDDRPTGVAISKRPVHGLGLSVRRCRGR